MEIVEKEMTVWLTYHDDAQIEQYNLKEDDIIRLFKGNNTEVEGENINHLNRFYSEMTTMYWVWKNKKRSKYVGFCHYRRRFTHFMEIEHGECQVMEMVSFPFTVFQHYKDAHNYNDFYDIVDILNEKYGKGNKYSEYMLNSKTFIPFCSYIMHYDDFESLCEFLFQYYLISTTNITLIWMPTDIGQKRKMISDMTTKSISVELCHSLQKDLLVAILYAI